ncbi:methyltransferase domain-containing protein [bacterium 1xD8-48]|nr:methyltransferase domain-containing protein [bacterium 1xD8-48]
MKRNAVEMKTCRCCGKKELQLLIDFGMQPVAHRLLDSKEQEDDFTHPLCLYYCENCGFVQIDNPIAPEQLYTQYNYCFSGWKKQPHIPAEIELLNRHIGNKDINILEIGCNDGVFLDPLRKAGYKNVIGIEANPYAAKVAEGVGFKILNVMFNKRSAEEIQEQYNGFDMVIMRQVVEHIEDLRGLFESLDLILNGEKLLFIEVPDFGEALRSGDCSTIWEEHPNYFTYNILEFLLNTKGYKVLEKDFYDFSGGAICVLAKKEKTAIANVKKDMTAYNNFANVVNNYAVKLKSALRNAHEKGIKVFLYGTGARACTLINGLGIEEIDCAIDDQKEKQNHYMPGSHLPILSLEKVSDSADKKVFLLAVNHENEEMVSKKILLHNNAKNVKIISLFAPNDIFKEVEKVEELL